MAEAGCCYYWLRMARLERINAFRRYLNPDIKRDCLKEDTWVCEKRYEAAADAQTPRVGSKPADGGYYLIDYRGTAQLLVDILSTDQVLAKTLSPARRAGLSVGLWRKGGPGRCAQFWRFLKEEGCFYENDVRFKPS